MVGFHHHNVGAAAWDKEACRQNEGAAANVQKGGRERASAFASDGRVQVQQSDIFASLLPLQLLREHVK